MASLSHLANELVEYIVSYLSQPDIYSVCRLNKSLYTLALPFLYRHVDLFIPPGHRLPRIDWFCLNIINDSQKARRVESIRLGLCSGEGVLQGQRWLAQDKHFDDRFMFEKAMVALSNETLVAAGDYLRDAIGMREYSSYAALALLVLPSLQRVDIADSKSASFDHLHTILRNLNGEATWNRRHASRALLDRLSSIKEMSVNVDKYSGAVYPTNIGRSKLDHVLNLPGINKLEFSVPDGQGRAVPLIPGHPGLLRAQLVNTVRPTIITTLVIRHSAPLLQMLESLLACVPQLRSLTCEVYFDYKGQEDTEARLIDLAAWSESLQQVKETLETLVFSTEFCNTDNFSFNQPKVGEQLYGYLDLTNLDRLHNLQVPFPFLTGDIDFSITTEIYPLLPPNIRHLSLRPDLSHAQLPYPIDLSILPNGLTFQETKAEAQHMMNARMDISYMFQASLAILDQASNLETISVWQPAWSLLDWFDGQVADFATTCQNKSVTGKLIFPMMLRWKKAEHWDLIKEVTVFDRSDPTQGRVEKLFRSEWQGMPLGLASQYHLYALRSHQIRLRR